MFTFSSYDIVLWTSCSRVNVNTGDVILVYSLDILGALIHPRVNY
jgi:hypothetical protein